MALLDLTLASDDARAGTSISALGSAATIAVKIRLNGACFLSPAAYARRIIWEIGSLAGARRCNIIIYHDPSPNPDVVEFRILSADGTNITITYDRTAIVSGDFYVLYGQLGVGGFALELFTSAGASLAVGSNADTSLGNLNNANGKLSVGQGVDSATTTDGIVGRVDGIAVYSASLGVAGAAGRYSAPSAGDANLLSFVGFDEGTGTTAADVATGGQTLTLSGAGWQAGGVWSGVASSTAGANRGAWPRGVMSGVMQGTMRRVGRLWAPDNRLARPSLRDVMALQGA